MKKNIKLVLNLFLLLFVCFSLHAQKQIQINSHGFQIFLTIWEGNENPSETVLLVPGWGGGPSDVMGLGKFLSDNGIPAVVISPRGWHQSQGTATFANGLQDYNTAIRWIRDSGNADKYNLNAEDIIMVGHSWGGGTILAYAAKDTTIRKVISIAGTDHALMIQQYQRDKEFKAMVDEILQSTEAPDGPIRFSTEYTMNELKENQDTYGLIRNADKLAKKDILILGGWEDVNVTVDNTLLPFYRALKKEGADDVTFIVYHTNHGFGNVRKQLQEDILKWINSR